MNECASPDDFSCDDTLYSTALVNTTGDPLYLVTYALCLSSASLMEFDILCSTLRSFTSNLTSPHLT